MEIAKDKVVFSAILAMRCGKWIFKKRYHRLLR
jgi:hypothetical protein